MLIEIVSWLLKIEHISIVTTEFTHFKQTLKLAQNFSWFSFGAMCINDKTLSNQETHSCITVGQNKYIVIIQYF